MEGRQDREEGREKMMKKKKEKKKEEEEEEERESNPGKGEAGWKEDKAGRRGGKR